MDMEYDPNMTLCGRMAKQTVKLTLQEWNYKIEDIEAVDIVIPLYHVIINHN